MGTSPSASDPPRDLLVHAWIGTDDEKAVTDIEMPVDIETAKLWNPSASDLAEVRRGLKELTEKAGWLSRYCYAEVPHLRAVR